MIFFKIPSLMTKGLKFATLFKDSGNVSKGKIVLEKNKNKLAKLIVARSDVSSDLNKYPTSMPIRINKETISNKEKNTIPKTGTSLPLKKKEETAKIMPNCKNKTRRFVKKCPRRKILSFTGVIKFLKKAGLVFSRIIKLLLSKRLISITTRTINVGKRKLKCVFSTTTGVICVRKGLTTVSARCPVTEEIVVCKVSRFVLREERVSVLTARVD